MTALALGDLVSLAGPRVISDGGAPPAPRMTLGRVRAQQELYHHGRHSHPQSHRTQSDSRNFVINALQIAHDLIHISDSLIRDPIRVQFAFPYAPCTPGAKEKVVLGSG
jgi:hypothetical protein